jgi:hypothetical protein
MKRITPKYRNYKLHCFEDRFSDTPTTGFGKCYSKHLPKFKNLWEKQQYIETTRILKEKEKSYEFFKKNAEEYKTFYRREFNQHLKERMDALVQKINTLDEHHQKKIEALKAEIATCTFSEEQCVSELENYRKLLQQDREMSGEMSGMIPKYQSRDAVRSAYRREELSRHDASMMLRNILIRKAIENAEWYCPGKLFHIAQQDLLSY